MMNQEIMSTTGAVLVTGKGAEDISKALLIIKQKLVAWELQKPTTAELRRCQQVLDSVVDAVNVLAAHNHHTSLTELSNLRASLKSEIASRIALESRVNTLEKEKERVEKEKETQHKIMLIRQIASAYQHKAAKFCGVGKQRKQFCITHEQLSLMGSKDASKLSKFQQIERIFLTEGLIDTLDINSLVKIIRELGFSTSTSHPSTMTSGRAATYADLVLILNSASTEGHLPDEVVDDAQKILNVANQLHVMLALGGNFLDTTV